MNLFRKAGSFYNLLVIINWVIAHMPSLKVFWEFLRGTKRYWVLIKRVWNRGARSKELMPPQTPPPDW
jgi:hypothetical protein